MTDKAALGPGKSTAGAEEKVAVRRISYTPAVPDGPECPWTRDRRTRWWLVLPADLLAVVLIAFLSAASVHDTSQAPALLAAGAVSLLAGWVAAWLLARPTDHLEAAGRDGVTVVAVTWVVWVVARLLAGADGVVGFALMLACFMLIGMGGWRWLYGFAKAQESLTPKAVQRRLDAQEAAGLQDGASQDED
nr:DUF3054 family protein [Actinomyces sp.]